MKKRKGQVGTALSLFIFLMLLFLIVYELQVHQYDATKVLTEDALAASNLASAVIDLEEYGKSHHILIQDTDEAYRLYQEALQLNMGLNDAWESENKSAVSGPVEVLDYVVYNVSGSDLLISSYGQNPYEITVKDGLGSVTAPNGTMIESTSVYSRITFPVKGSFGVQVGVVKDKLVDIVSN